MIDLSVFGAKSDAEIFKLKTEFRESLIRISNEP